LARATEAPIRIWPEPYGSDPLTHFWYRDPANRNTRLCDGATRDESKRLRHSTIYAPCWKCRDLYVADAAHGANRLYAATEELTHGRAVPLVVYSTKFGEETPNFGVYPTSNGVVSMTTASTDKVPPVSMATFARFHEAARGEQLNIVKDARIFHLDRTMYERGRDYYREFRNALRQTHWQTGDIGTFEAALTPLLIRVKKNKRESYKQAGEAYVALWKRRDADYFPIPRTTIDIAGLTIRVNPELGMSFSHDKMALKLWLNAPKPTRGYRQAIQYMCEVGRKGLWEDSWTMTVWDVRREETLPPVRIQKDIDMILEGDAIKFQHLWKRLGAGVVAALEDDDE